MNNETKIIISFLYKRSGKEKLTLSEMYLPLSIDLKWFSPKEAMSFLNSALQKKILIKKGDLISPNFDYKKIVVPTGFQPSKQTFTKAEGKVEAGQDIVEKIIGRIVKKTGEAEQGIYEKIKKIKENRNISFEVATLLVGREYGIKLEDCFEKAEDEIFKEKENNWDQKLK